MCESARKIIILKELTSTSKKSLIKKFEIYLDLSENKPMLKMLVYTAAQWGGCMVFALTWFSFLQFMTPKPRVDGNKSYWREAWKWLDILVASIPLIGQVYEFMSYMLQECWAMYLCWNPSTVYNIQMLPIPSAFGSRLTSEEDELQNQPLSLDAAWRSESVMTLRDLGNYGQERTWTFKSQHDYLIQYCVRDSYLPTSFLAFYPKNTVAIFPPMHLRTYWSRPLHSAIESATWSHTMTPVKAEMLQILQQTCGPSQFGPENVASRTPSTNNPHLWNFHLYKYCFPNVFTQPETTRTPINETSEISASERRRLNRQKQLINESNNNVVVIIGRMDGSQSVLYYPS
jgi:hypothetical protein